MGREASQPLWNAPFGSVDAGALGPCGLCIVEAVEHVGIVVYLALGPDAERCTDQAVDLNRDLGIRDQEPLGVLAAQAQLFALLGVPSTRLLHDAVLDTHVEQRALTADALPVHDVELGLAERRRHLVENAFADLKQFRWIATRGHKLAVTFVALVQMHIWQLNTKRKRRPATPYLKKANSKPEAKPPTARARQGRLCQRE